MEMQAKEVKHIIIEDKGIFLSRGEVSVRVDATVSVQVITPEGKPSCVSISIKQLLKEWRFYQDRK